MNRYKPVGWRGESHRHYLASKGVSTVSKRYFEGPVGMVDRQRDVNRWSGDEDLELREYLKEEGLRGSRNWRKRLKRPVVKEKVIEIQTSLPSSDEEFISLRSELKRVNREMADLIRAKSVSKDEVDRFISEKPDSTRGTWRELANKYGYFAKKEPVWDFVVENDGEKMKWLDGAKDGKISEEEYIEGNLKRHEEGGWPAFIKSVGEQTAHPFKDMDGDWERYTALAENDKYGPRGVPEKLSDDKMERTQQRAAATMAKILTQANVEPLLDHGKDSTVRDLTIDLVFGRTDMPRVDPKEIKYFEKEKGAMK